MLGLRPATRGERLATDSERHPIQGAPCTDLALALAHAVLDAPLVALARRVVDDHEHRYARATELAEDILKQADGGSQNTATGHARRSW